MKTWSISYSYPIVTDNGERMHKLHVFMINKDGSVITGNDHGKLFVTYCEAFDYAKKSGLLDKYKHYTKRGGFETWEV